MSFQPILTVQQLSLAGSKGTLFQNIEFTVSQGEVLAIMGPSGTGKSMLLKAVAGFLPSDVAAEGSIQLNGNDVSQLYIMQRTRNQRPGVIFQDALKALNSLASVEQQLALALTANRTRLKGTSRTVVTSLLEQLGFSDPDSVLTLYPTQLSGGQRQRICIAIALLGSANLLIADEPTSALDPITEIEILNLFRDSVRQRGIGGILITHDLPTALTCDRILIIADGAMLAYGSPTEAIRQSPHPFCRQLVQLIPEVNHA